MRLFETCYRDLPGKASEAAAQVKLCMGVFFDFVVLVFRRVSLLKAFDPGSVKQQFQILSLPVQFCLSTINRKRMT